MKHKRLWLAVVGMLLVLLVLTVTVTIRTNNRERTRHVVIVLKSREYSEFWQEVISGAIKGTENENITYEIVGGEDENDVTGQIALLNKVIEQKPDGIILAASDHFRIDPITKNIMDAGIKLVLVDSGVTGDNYNSFVSTENYMAGYKAGLELGELMNNPEYVVIVNHVQGALTAIEREQGFKDAMKMLYNDATIGIFYANDKEEAAERYVTQLIQYGIQIDGIVALNEVSTIGTANALNPYHELIHVPFVGMDNSIDEIRYLEKGVIDKLIVQQPFYMGYTSMGTLIDAMKGDRVKDKIDTGSKVITRDNMYDEVNQMLLFPFNESEGPLDTE